MENFLARVVRLYEQEQGGFSAPLAWIVRAAVVMILSLFGVFFATVGDDFWGEMERVLLTIRQGPSGVFEARRARRFLLHHIPDLYE